MPLHRVHNFNAGPSILPQEALLQAQKELLDINGTGMSILEHSHRGSTYEAIHQEALTLFRELLKVPAEYEILFLQGGASHQFAMLPLNFLPPGKTAGYILTGVWGEKAYEEASRIGNTKIVKSTKGNNTYTRAPAQEELSIDPDLAYVHYTTNETIHGVQFPFIPNTKKVPLLADMSSDILSKEIDITPFSLIYAGAQKNIGPSGIAVVILKKDYLAQARTDIPTIWSYQTHVKSNSLYNTPPTFSIYLIRNVLQWIKAQGGIPAIQEQNRKKAELLYQTLSEYPSVFEIPVEKNARSFMNVVFRLRNPEKEAVLLDEAKKNAIVGIKGHRSVGGMRVSLYNAISLQSVQHLTNVLHNFASKQEKL